MLIRGDKLNPKQRHLVLGAYIYRRTTGNGRINEAYRGLSRPTVPKVSDDQWLADHAFHFVKDGSRLARNRRHAEPAFLAA